MFLTTVLLICLASFYALLYLWRRRGEGLRDMLTGLPNRDYLMRHIEHCAARAVRRSDYDFGVVLFTIDDLATHRRALGRFGLEEVLADVAERLFWTIRPTDVLARLEGDVFAIVLDDVKCIADVQQVVMRIQATLDRAVSLAGREVFVSASVGITMAGAGATAESLIAQAEEARHRCEAEQADCVAFDETAHRASVQTAA